MSKTRKHKSKTLLKLELEKLRSQASIDTLSSASRTALGDRFVDAREWLDAIECFKIVIEQDNTNVNALSKLGYACGSAGLLTEAMNAYLTALQIEPERQHLLKDLGAIQLARGLPSLALDYLERAIALKHKDPDCHYFLGEAYRLLKELELSAAQYFLAVKLYRSHTLDAATMIKVGRSLGFLRRHEAATNFLREAAIAAPEMPGAHFELACIYRASENEAEEIESLRRTLELAPRHTGALRAYAKLMASHNKLEKSAWAFRRLSQIYPEDASIRHMLSAYTQENVKGATDEVYVKDIFDHYADSFENHLVEGLGYRAPQLMRALYEPHRKSDKLAIIDLGCGTGLCGPLFKDIASQLVGVDLSQGMLKEAHKKAVYDRLMLSELTSALEEEYQTQNLLIAADVMIYVGDLNPVFKAAHQALQDGGQLLFSIEIMENGDYTLAENGRYRHSYTYIEALAIQHGLHIIAQQTSTLRTESRKPVEGELYLLEKTSGR